MKDDCALPEFVRLIAVSFLLLLPLGMILLLLLNHAEHRGVIGPWTLRLTPIVTR
jgi:hypothetical protein